MTRVLVRIEWDLWKIGDVYEGILEAFRGLCAVMEACGKQCNATYLSALLQNNLKPSISTTLYTRLAFYTPSMTLTPHSAPLHTHTHNLSQP